MIADDSPFYTNFTPEMASRVAVARRPIMSRAVRADAITPAHGPVFVWGEPLIGKTTLVRQVLWSLEPDQFVVCRIPAGALAEDDEHHGRCGAIVADQIGVQLAGATVLPEALTEAQTASAAIAAACDFAAQSGRQMVLAIEGVERFQELGFPRGARENLTQLLALSPAISIVLTSRLPLWRLDNVDLPQEMRVHFVPPLDPGDAKRLLTAPVRGRYEYGTESLKLLTAAGGRPFLLQIIGRNCQRVLEASGGGCITLHEAGQILRGCWPAGDRVFRPILGAQRAAGQRALAALAAVTEETPSAPLEAVVPKARALGFGGTPEELEYELGRLRVWRLVGTTPANEWFLTIGWLAQYLRAGAPR